MCFYCQDYVTGYNLLSISDLLSVCQSGDNSATYPYDCTQYYECEGLIPDLKSCGDGFVYSYQYQACVRPSLAPCAGIDGSGEIIAFFWHKRFSRHTY